MERDMCKLVTALIFISISRRTNIKWIEKSKFHHNILLFSLVLSKSKNYNDTTLSAYRFLKNLQDFQTHNHNVPETSTL